MEETLLSHSIKGSVEHIPHSGDRNHYHYGCQLCWGGEQSVCDQGLASWPWSIKHGYLYFNHLHKVTETNTQILVTPESLSRQLQESASVMSPSDRLFACLGWAPWNSTARPLGETTEDMRFGPQLGCCLLGVCGFGEVEFMKRCRNREGWWSFKPRVRSKPVPEVSGWLSVQH